MDEMHARTALLLGEKALNRLGDATVAVFGVGGVGSFAAEGLARSGVGRLILVDHDTVVPSNLNRQLEATVETLGCGKARAMADRILKIRPNMAVEAVEAFYSAGQADRIFSILSAASGTNLIIDAIDSLASKIHLILQAKQRGIPVISSMGAGNRLDPSAFRVADIYSTEGCPLAKRVRKGLREAGVASHVVVYSTELPVRKGPPGSIICVTGAAGLILAGEAIRQLLAAPGEKKHGACTENTVATGSPGF
ncbi:MAG TPA: hypothetical protein DD727_06370 [Clostridiales bacterium]|nr:hypothetical protein [Clostridiales bacterium]